MKKITVCLLLLAVLLCSLPAASAEYDTPCGVPVLCAYRGDRRSFPENSIEAVRSAFSKGADKVFLNVCFTADGTAVCCADEDLSRVACDNSGKKISGMTLAELGAYTLKNGSGGELQNDTNIKIPALEEVLKAFPENEFILDCAFENIEKLIPVVKDFPGVSLVLDCKMSEYESIKQSLDGISVILYCKTNNRIRLGARLKTDEALWLASSNTYAVVWKERPLQKSKSSSLIVCTAEPGFCGLRLDTAEYWDDLVMRGYDTIITDDIDGFVRYQKDCAKSSKMLCDYRAELENEFTLPALKSYSFLDYKKAYTDAVAAFDGITAKKATGDRESRETLENLRRAVTAIKCDYAELSQGVAGVTVSPGRIITAVLAAAAVIFFQIWFFRRRK